MKNKKIDIPICVCVELKTVMVISASIKINPHELFEKLEYILKVEHDVSNEDFEKFKVKLIDTDTTISNLKRGWKF